MKDCDWLIFNILCVMRCARVCALRKAQQ